MIINTTNASAGTSRLVFFIAIFMGGCLAIFFGKELGWDLANYHYYNPYVFLSHRSTIDYWPSSFIHQYLNPTSDFLTYFLINYFPPLVTEFILGAIHGINFWLLFLIAYQFIQGDSKTPMALLIAALGMCGPIALPSLGSFQNDHLISVFVLSAVVIQIQCLFIYSKKGTLNYKFYCISGLLLGAGVGLKLTAGIYILSTMLALIFLPISIKERVRLCSITSIAILIGICSTSGYWMYLMWHQHHNPFFPFLNNLFHSADFALKNWRDTRFLPHGIREFLFFPFYYSWDGRISDVPFRDFRFMFVYLLLIPSLLCETIWPSKKILATYWVYIFFITAYLIWQAYFSIARYALPLELLSPLIIYLLLRQLFRSDFVLDIVVIILFSGLLYYMQPIHLTRSFTYKQSFFEVELPQIVNTSQNAMVLMSYPAFVMDMNPRPQTYLIPFFPVSWRFIGIPFIHQQYYADDFTEKKIISMISKAHTPLYLLTASADMPALFKVAHIFNLVQNGNCMEIKTARQKLIHQIILLCPVAMIGS